MEVLWAVRQAGAEVEVWHVGSGHFVDEMYEIGQVRSRRFLQFVDREDQEAVVFADGGIQLFQNVDERRCRIVMIAR